MSRELFDGFGVTARKTHRPAPFTTTQSSVPFQKTGVSGQALTKRMRLPGRVRAHEQVADGIEAVEIAS